MINCAGLAKVFGRPADFQAANVDFVAKLLNGCIAENARRRKAANDKTEEVRFIQLSTASIYFKYCDQNNISESAEIPKKLACDYTKSKYDAEQLINKSGLSATLLRTHMVVGAGDNLIVSKLLKHLHTAPLPIFNHGQANLDMTSIENLVSAIVLCVEKKESMGKTFNITNDHPQKLVELLQILSDSFEIAIKTQSIPFSISLVSPIIALLEWSAKTFMHPLGYDPDLFINQMSGSIMAYDFTLDNTAAKNILGYKPTVTTKETLDASAQWYKEKAGIPTTSLASSYSSLWRQENSRAAASSATPELTLATLKS